MAFFCGSAYRGDSNNFRVFDIFVVSAHRSGAFVFRLGFVLASRLASSDEELGTRGLYESSRAVTQVDGLPRAPSPEMHSLVRFHSLGEFPCRAQFSGMTR